MVQIRLVHLEADKLCRPDSCTSRQEKGVNPTRARRGYAKGTQIADSKTGKVAQRDSEGQRWALLSNLGTCSVKAVLWQAGECNNLVF